ncbi:MULTISPECIES: DUF3106 domain-containing protein [unclassified Massilia]|uniref:DUF3106 domain-containing protein n=1 Tax=unclassified Massilia TaxID=2609279 RepID=UPI00068983A9|nr:MULTISPECIES: DUF3106 domain-containing protein [unclassified Massilia]AWG45878.1 hypothetical protein AM586_20130 [Massilia sp. WG5]
MTGNKGKVAAAGAAVVFAGLVLLFSQQHDRAGMPGSAAPAADASSADSAVHPGNAGAPLAHKGGDKPLWRALTPAQQLALQPLQSEWDQMDGVRKQKWLQLANRFAGMNPEEQQRVHARMREWVKLTPAQRELARETYARARKIGPDQKTASWENYQQLSEEQKKKLAASAAGRKTTSVVPSQASGKVVVPLGQGATSCPAGTVKNTVSATPPCVAVPATPQQPAPVPAPQPAQPAQPANPSQQEKPVPANWGISPNNA